MGNCLNANRVHEDTEALSDQPQLPTLSKSFEPVKPTEVRKKKVVRFKLDNEEAVESSEEQKKSGQGGNGVVRLRIMVTQEELNQLLRYKKNLKYSSVEALLSAMKVSGRKMMDIRKGGGEVGNGWRPTLESISEEH